MPVPGPQTTSDSAIRGYFYGMRFTRNLLFHYSIMTAFYLSNHLSVQSIMFLESIYWTTRTIVEVPCGYLADVTSRKATLVAGTLLNSVGLAAFAFVDGFNSFAVTIAAVALSHSMCAGADSAMLLDALTARGQTAEFRQIEGRGVSARHLGLALCIPLGSLIAHFSDMRNALLLSAICILIGVPLAVLFPAGGSIKRERTSVSDMVALVRGHLGRTTFVIVGWHSIWFVVQCLGYWTFQLALIQLDIGIAWFGIVFASSMILTAASSSVSGRYTAGLRARVITAMFFIGAAAYLLAAVGLRWAGPAGTGLLLLGLALNALVIGPYSAVARDWLKDIVPSARYTTSIAFMILFGNLAFAAVSPLLAVSIRNIGLSTTLLWVAILLMACAICSMVVIDVPNIYRKAGK